jgi:hypothetical protein
MSWILRLVNFPFCPDYFDKNSQHLASGYLNCLCLFSSQLLLLNLFAKPGKCTAVLFKFSSNKYDGNTKKRKYISSEEKLNMLCKKIWCD